MAEEQALVQLMDTLDGLELTKSEYEWLEQRCRHDGKGAVPVPRCDEAGEA